MCCAGFGFRQCLVLVLRCLFGVADIVFERFHGLEVHLSDCRSFDDGKESENDECNAGDRHHDVLVSAFGYVGEDVDRRTHQGCRNEIEPSREACGLRHEDEQA